MQVFCPNLATVPVKLWDYLAGLPIMPFNKELLRYLRSHPGLPLENFTVAVFTHDIFQIRPRFLSELKSLRVRSITNFPSIEALDGYAYNSMANLGYALDKELEFLLTARKMGLDPVAFAYKIKHLEEFAKNDLKNVIVALTASEENTGIKADPKNFQRIEKLSKQRRLKLFAYFAGERPTPIPENLFVSKASICVSPPEEIGNGSN